MSVRPLHSVSRDQPSIETASSELGNQVRNIDWEDVPLQWTNTEPPDEMAPSMNSRQSGMSLIKFWSYIPNQLYALYRLNERQAAILTLESLISKM